MFSKKNRLSSAEQIQNEYPLTGEIKNKKSQFDSAILRNMRERTKLTVVIGPCSADNVGAVTEYARHLKSLQDIHPNLLIVMRVYTSKPHSDGNGYKGLCFHEKISDPCDCLRGIAECRRLMKNVLEIGLPIADELLYPEFYGYFSDAVSYWFLGARSSEDSLHRDFASGLDLPCGVKNPVDGSLNSVVNSLNAVSKPCVFPFEGAQIETDGNKCAHVVLRGGVGENGFFSNISPSQTRQCKEILSKMRLNDFLMADLSHANSGKVAANQLKNAEAVARDKNVDGVMAESYLFDGISQDTYGVSKTDACLSIDDTARLLDILEEGFVNGRH